MIELIAPKYGAHVALTGGALYKTGLRKDADILFYRIRQAERIELRGLFEALEEVGIHIGLDYGWVVKAIYERKKGEEPFAIDFFLPERDYEVYPAKDLLDEWEYGL